MENSLLAKQEWKETLTPTNNIFTLNLRELWNYRDLLFIWVKRDISAIYKQTILGPAWFFIQPVLTAVTYIIIFSRIARFSTIGLPPSVFYLSGIILWSYFSDCLLKTSSFLKDNSAIFSKVYFPRLIIPVSIVITNLVKFAIQFVLFLIVYFYFLLTTKTIHPTAYIVCVPLLLFSISMLGFGSGILIASITIRYKDLTHLIGFGIQLLMFISPVFFPLESMGKGVYRSIILANPMSGFIEAFRYFFTGKGYMSWPLLTYDLASVLILLFIGIVTFNYSEKSFIDTI
jgi:lipopolysaccharide transport system permease protein